MQMRLHIVEREIGDNQAHAAVDVESDAAGRNDAAFAHVHRCDAADRKAIAAMAIGHAERVTRNPGQSGDVADLLVNGLVHFANQLFGRNDPRRHAHAVLVSRRQFPNRI